MTLGSGILPQYEGYFSVIYQENLKDRFIFLRNATERSKFLAKHFIPVLAESYLSSIDLKRHDILLYCKSTDKSDVFYALDKVEKVADRIEVQVQRITTYLDNPVANLDCKCYVIKLPKSKTDSPSTEEMLSNISLTIVNREITDEPQFVGMDFNPREENFQIANKELETRAYTLQKEMEIRQKKERVRDYIERVNLALTAIFGTFLGGISRAEIPLPIETTRQPVRASRVYSVP